MALLMVWNGLIFVLLVAMGVLFLRGKGTALISGLNTMSESEKSGVDKKRLCRFMGKFMLVLAALWLVITILEVCQLKIWLLIGVGVFVVVTVGAAIYANTGNRFKK